MQAKLKAVPFTRVTIKDEFWAPRIETNRKVTIPTEYKMVEETGRIASFDLKWRAGDPNPPHIFWDSDVAKWIEAASYSLASYPDAALDSLLDTVIARIAKAQQPDGYLNTHYQQVEPDKRWTNLRDNHELYCAGHLIEAAVAHFSATGKRSLLDAVCRYADHIASVFGAERGKKRGYPGHEEVELALVKLYHTTNEARYLNLARYFIDERGQQPYYYDIEARERGDDPASFWARTYAYMQALVPVREQQEVTGHAVRAMYLYSAMADIANETGDRELLSACERLWNDLCTRRMYLTGGIGPSASNEGFTTPYDLPDETAYAETCAAVGLVFWNHRMLQFEGSGKYADVMERALYNGTISGVSVDGRTFFYENPLASSGKHHRRAWFDCACCPPNIARMLASLGGYAYSEGDHDAWVHLYAQGVGKLQLADTEVSIEQTTRYPWDGTVKLQVSAERSSVFALHLRIPGWCQRYTVSVNGEHNPAWETVQDGYVAIKRQWVTGDAVELHLHMPVQYVVAHPKVQQMQGRVAIQRGPVVYCAESVDNQPVALGSILIKTSVAADAAFSATFRPGLLGGVTVLQGAASVDSSTTWDKALYQFLPQSRKQVGLTLIPYYAWDNREPGEMRVWFRTE